MSERKTYIDFAEVKEKITVPMVLEKCGVDMSQYREVQGRLRGPCPLPSHPESEYRNKQQFVADHKKQGYWLFHCFGDCDRGGDVIELCKEMTGLDDRHVRRWIDEHFGDLLTAKPAKRERPAADTSSKEDDTKPVDESSRVSPTPKPEPATEVPQDEPAAQAKPAKSPRETKPKRLGPLRWRYNLDRDHGYLRERGLKPEVIERYGIGFCSKGMMKDRIAIPIWLPGQESDANPVAYLGRAVSDDVEPRYLLPEGFERNECVYGLREALQSEPTKPLVIVEGCFKVYWLYQEADIDSAVATFGSSLGPGQAQQLIATGRPLVLLWDGNARDKARKACGQLIKDAFVRVIVLGEDLEPDDLSGDELRNLLDFMID